MRETLLRVAIKSTLLQALRDGNLLVAVLSTVQGKDRLPEKPERNAVPESIGKNQKISGGKSKSTKAKSNCINHKFWNKI